MDYKQAGVDVEAGREFVKKITDNVASTYRKGVLGGLGGFGGCFEIPAGYRQPVLVSGTDGVGTKLKIAQELNRHDTVGIDLVAMCVNDILTSSAEPLFFLDYLATGKLDSNQLAEVINGIITGCQESGCALLGGETAEMPGFYPSGEYDLGGFCVGIVEKSQILDGSKDKRGDIAISLASTGIHSNGFSLVRKIIETQGFRWDDQLRELGGQTLGEICLTPTRIYVQPVLSALKSGLEIKAMAHITGGGIPGNLPRVLPDGVVAVIQTGAWPVPPIFGVIERMGNVPADDMKRTFNMGIGYVMIIGKRSAEIAVSILKRAGYQAYVIGRIEKGRNGVRYE